MSPKHTNPSWDKPRYDRNARQEVHARAPYNFISLPEKVVTVDLPSTQDHYEGLSGWIDCEIETKSPTYIRGMLTEAQYRQQGELDPADLTLEQKEERAPFFNVNQRPFIPGSSLRGMVRAMIEIAGFGRMRWVGKEPTFTFRAVAAQTSDPLREPYQNALGKFGARVKAGYLVCDDQDQCWYIQPAQLPKSLGFSERNAYLKVKERNLLGLSWYTPFRDRAYQPTYYPVSFDMKDQRGERGTYTAITQIDKRDAGLKYQGMLVCSGNMIETDPGGQTLRKNQALLLPIDAKAQRLLIPKEALEAYKFGLTPFQREALGDWQGGEWGCLKNGAPVFYVAENNQVLYFGHSPNFRIPAYLYNTQRAAVPTDFIPPEHGDDRKFDFADVLFGWAPEPGSDRKDSCAGRVFFEDARLLPDQTDIWYRQDAMAPHVLGAPKPTTFQHYLVQDKTKGHEPDRKETLAHYGTSNTQTQIRGQKLYWHRGRNPDIEATEEEREHETQLSRIHPLKPGVRLQFRVRFENLRDTELGALLWAINPRGEAGKTYCHKLGMGKPLGMGAVQLSQAAVHLTDRKEKRYQALFASKDGKLAWNMGETPVEADYRDAFETYIENAVSPGTPFRRIERIEELLTMLEWRGDDPGQDWKDWTRYMEIERPIPQTNKTFNEYKERPVLPRPGQVVRWATGSYATDERQVVEQERPVREKGPAQPLPQQTPPTRPVVQPPKPGDILHGEVSYSESNGTLWLENLNCPAPEGVEVSGVIFAKNLNSKQYSEGMKVRLEVIEVKISKEEWIISCRPGAKPKK